MDFKCEFYATLLLDRIVLNRRLIMQFILSSEILPLYIYQNIERYF